MALLLYGVSIYVTVANAWFLLSAFSSDLLFIRFYLLMAYIFLFIAGWTNYPPWGTWTRVNTSTWLLGGIIWPFVTGCFHMQGFLSLLWDERRITFRNEDEEQLWRLVHRRSGMGRLEFKFALELGRWVRYKPGDTIYDTQGDSQESASALHLMAAGLGEMQVQHKHKLALRDMRSGYVFDLAILNVFGVYIGLERSPVMSVKAKTDVLLYKWDLAAVEKMASGCYPALSQAWRNLTLYQLGSAFSQVAGEVYCATGGPESEDFLSGGRSKDMTDPLDIDRSFLNTVWDKLVWIISTHNPFPPPGIRHLSMPTSGMLARGRFLATRTSLNSYRSIPGLAEVRLDVNTEDNAHNSIAHEKAQLILNGDHM